MSRSRGDTAGQRFVERTTVDAALRVDDLDTGLAWFEATVIDAEPYIVGPLVATRPRPSALLRGEERDELRAYVDSIVAEAMGLAENSVFASNPWPGALIEHDPPATRRVEVVTVPARKPIKKSARTRTRTMTILNFPCLEALIVAENARVEGIAAAESARVDLSESTRLELAAFDERTEFDRVAAFISKHARRVVACVRRNAKAAAVVKPLAHEVAARVRPYTEKVIARVKPHTDNVVALAKPYTDRVIAFVGPHAVATAVLLEAGAEKLRLGMGVLLRLLRREARANPRAAGLMAGLTLSALIVLPIGLGGSPEDASMSAKATDRALVAVVRDVAPAPQPPVAASALTPPPATRPGKVTGTRTHEPRRGTRAHAPPKLTGRNGRVPPTAVASGKRSRARGW